MANALQEIREWIGGQPFWEQAALDKVLAGTPVTDGDYKQFFQFLQEDAGLLPRTGKRPGLYQLQRAGMTVRPRSPAPRLVEIANVQHVNALDSGQRLTFGPAVTLVFGSNGSGKTGYARLLAAAGFSRGEREVLPNVLAGTAGASGPASAEISLSDSAGVKVHRFAAGTSCADLGRIYVFDSSSVAKQLTAASPFHFSPVGLSCLSDLSDIVDRVRGLLDEKVRELRQPPAFLSAFAAGSDAFRLLQGLSAKSRVAALRQFATVPATDQQRSAQIEVEIARLRAGDTSGRIAELSRAQADLAGLMQGFERLRIGTSEHALQAAVAARERLLAAQQAAQRQGAEEFNGDGFTGAGTREWRDLVSSARRLAGARSGYPQPGDDCLLCRQPLGDDARDLLTRIWRYLEDDSASRSAQAQNEVAQVRQALGRIDVDICDEQSIHHRLLQQYAPGAIAGVHGFAGAVADRVAWAQRLLDDPERTPPSAPPAAEPPLAAIARIVETLESEQRQLHETNPAPRIAALQAEAAALADRVRFAELLPEIEAYIVRLGQADALARLRPSTTNITVKHNQLFDSLVTERYAELFQETLDSLGRPLRVRIATRGQKGAKLKSLALDLAPDVKVGADRVLSDGEKRAVALADFLAEAHLDENSGAIVLDDPATALDEQWAAAAANRLAEEGRDRQVIVLTHDLPFARELERRCRELGVNLLEHELRRNPATNLTGVIVPDGGVLVAASGS